MSCERQQVGPSCEEAAACPCVAPFARSMGPQPSRSLTFLKPASKSLLRIEGAMSRQDTDTVPCRMAQLQCLRQCTRNDRCLNAAGAPRATQCGLGSRLFGASARTSFPPYFLANSSVLTLNRIGRQSLGVCFLDGHILLLLRDSETSSGRRRFGSSAVLILSLSTRTSTSTVRQYESLPPPACSPAVPIRGNKAQHSKRAQHKLRQCAFGGARTRGQQAT